MKNYKVKIENGTQFYEVVELAEKLGYKKPGFGYHYAYDSLLLKDNGLIHAHSFKPKCYQEITIDQLRILADPKSLIGRKVKGFWFEDRKYNNSYYNPQIDKYIGKIGVIESNAFNSYLIRFNDNSCFTFPQELIHEHLIEETMKLTDLKQNQVVHCATEEEAIRICKIAHENGLKWIAGTSYIGENNWEEYKEETCYNFNNGAFEFIDYYKEEGYDIIPSTQIEDEPKQEQTQELKKVWAWDDDVEKAFETYLITEMKSFEYRYIVVDKYTLHYYESKKTFNSVMYKNISETDPRTPNDVLKIVEKYGKDKLITLIEKL